MKHLLRSSISLLSFIFLLGGCKKLAFFEGAGTTVVQQRSVASFNRINLYDKIDLILTQDTTESIRVEAGEKLQPYITTEVADGILSIRNKVGSQWLRNPAEKISIYVHVKTLNYLNYSGSGHISSTNAIQAGNITFDSRDGAGTIEVTLDAKQTFAYIWNNSADFVFHGHSDSCYAYVNARGSIDFKDFKVAGLRMGYGGLRDAYVNVSHSIYAELYYKGNVYYAGHPATIDTVNYNTGRLIRLN